MFSPFQRLARTHAASTATDAVIAVALAGSIFFSISPDAARDRIALYLALTVAPFAVVTPLIGPVIDRLAGGRRAMILVTNIGRFVVALLMIRHLDTYWLFPEAFTLLVFQKSYAVAKSAVVPRYVTSKINLVQANSRLALIAAVMSLVGASFGALLAFVGSPGVAAGAASVGYLIAALMTLQLPKVPVASQRPSDAERHELRVATILSSAWVMAVMRSAVGFVTFLLAFELRGGKEGLDVSADGAALGGAVAVERGIDIVGDPSAPIWHYAMVVAAAGLAAFGGVQLAPRLRRSQIEEVILLGSLTVLLSMALLGAISGGLTGMVVLSGGVAVSAAVGKLAFDSLVQRDAPDANHGRSFSRFEARFQIAWVVGAFVPVILPIPARLGSVLVALGMISALLSFVISRRRTTITRGQPQPGPKTDPKTDPNSDPDLDPDIGTADL